MLHLVHGWGFDRSIWDALLGALGNPAAALADRGYFGQEAALPASDGPVLAVGHSLGVMHLLHDLPVGCAGLVAINGFDRFCTMVRDDPTAVSHRIVDRMVTRFRDSPDQVLVEFRRRCGTEEPLPLVMRNDLLRHDLEWLRDGDERATAAQLDVPVLILQGEGDVIVVPSMQDAVFRGAAAVERHRLAGHGHLLPLTAPDWCADHIRAFAERLDLEL